MHPMLINCLLLNLKCGYEDNLCREDCDDGEHRARDWQEWTHWSSCDITIDSCHTNKNRFRCR